MLKNMLFLIVGGTAIFFGSGGGGEGGREEDSKYVPTAHNRSHRVIVENLVFPLPLLSFALPIGEDRGNAEREEIICKKNSKTVI